MCECARPVVGLIRGLHAAAEVLQVKAHDVIKAVHPPEPGVQLIPCHLHLLPVTSKEVPSCAQSE